MDPTTERRASWSVTLGTVIGVPIRIHFTFLILLIWFGFHASRVGHNPALALAFLALLFGCVGGGFASLGLFLFWFRFRW